MSEVPTKISKGKNIFNLLDKFFKQNHLDWGKLVRCTTNGALMLGLKLGFEAYVKAMSPSHFCSLFYTQICSLCQDNVTGFTITLKSNYQNGEFHKSISFHQEIGHDEPLHLGRN